MPPPNRNYTGENYRVTLTIPSGSAYSNAANIREQGPRGYAVRIGDAWTDAHLGLQTSLDQVTWDPWRDQEGNVVKITGIKTNEASNYIFPADYWLAGVWHYVRLVSLNPSVDPDDFTPLVQGGSRDVILILGY